MRVGVSYGRKSGILLLILVFFLVSFVWCAVRMYSSYITAVKAYANNMANKAISNSVSEVFSDKSSEMTSVEELNNTMLFKTDTAKVNLVNSELLGNLQEEILSSSGKVVYIPLGSVFKIAVFSGMGPKIPVKIHPVSIINTDFKEQFDSAGINQVRHSISVAVDVKMAYSGYMFSTDEKVSVTIPVTNTVIVGKVPEYYGSDAMEMIE